jgi:hypothetical protein
MKLEIFSTYFPKNYSNIIFHEYLLSGSPVFSTRTDEQTDMTKLTVAIRNFANVPKMTGFSRVYKNIICNLISSVLKTSSINKNEETPDEIRCGLDSECYGNAVT